MDEATPSRMTARLPGAWIPAELLGRVLKASGKRGFSAFIRRAMENELERVAGQITTRRTAQRSAHL